MEEPWPQRGRAAAIALVARGADRTRTAGVQLLADLREVFGASEKLAKSHILERLHDLPESAWNDVRGKPLDQRGLSWRLGQYGVKPKLLRLHPSACSVVGMKPPIWHDAWARYPAFPRTSVTSVTSVTNAKWNTSGTRSRRERSHKN